MKPLAVLKTLVRGLLSQWIFNLRAWGVGWGKFDEVHSWAPGWNGSQLRWKAVYATDYLLTVLVFAGPVASLSWWMNLHRQGKVWDKILDGIETVDPGHGDKAGGPLFGTTECSFPVRVALPIAWAFALKWLIGAVI